MSVNELLRDYRRDLARRHLAASTIRRRLAWAREVTAASRDPWAATTEQLERVLERHPLADKSRYDAISNVAQLYRWGIRTGRTATDPSALIVRPRIPRRLPRPARDVDVAVAMAAATGTTRTALALAALAGLRCIEIDRLRWADYDPAAAELRVIGKGGHERVVGVSPDLAAELHATAHTSTFVVDLGRVHHRASKVSVLIASHFDQVGAGDVTAHRLRHRLATVIHRQTGDLLIVADVLGHASLDMSRLYAQLDGRRARAAVMAAGRIPTL